MRHDENVAALTRPSFPARAAASASLEIGVFA
jgi:hypothetical protein